MERRAEDINYFDANYSSTTASLGPAAISIGGGIGVGLAISTGFNIDIPFADTSCYENGNDLNSHRVPGFFRIYPRLLQFLLVTW